MTGVVVGVDDSTQAEQALRWAAQQAELTNQPLTVTTVVDPNVAVVLWSDDPADAGRTAHLDAARKAVEELLSELEHDRQRPLSVPVTIRARVGHPVEELVEAATDADLLVVGSRGAGPLGRVVLGSVSTGVTHHAPCTVVVVRGRVRCGNGDGG